MGAWKMGGKLSAKSYVQDGLIAMWDGIENAGWGRHTDSLDEISPLVGSRRGMLGVDVSATDNGLALLKANISLGLTINLTTAVNDTGTAAGEGSTVEFLVAYDNYPTVNVGSTFSSNPWNVSTRWEVYFYPKSSTPIIRLISGNVAFNTGKRFYADGLIHSYAMRRVFGNGGLSCFKDGQVIASLSTSSSVEYTHSSIAFSSAGFTGTLNAIRVYSRPLSDAEMTANYAVDVKRFNLT